MVVVSLPIEKTIQLEVSADLIPPPPTLGRQFSPHHQPLWLDHRLYPLQVGSHRRKLRRVGDVARAARRRRTAMNDTSDVQESGGGGACRPGGGPGGGPRSGPTGGPGGGSGGGPGSGLRSGPSSGTARTAGNG